MEGRLYLHVPAFDELDYREKLMSDPATMSYNRGYELAFDGYHRQTGCIDFPRREWRSWYDYFIGQEPRRFYAYIVRGEDRAFIGEVNVHHADEGDFYEMGIVLEARYRGMGYAEEALHLLLKHAFEDMGASAVHNDFEASRSAAVRTHLACGFREYKHENGIIELRITREEFLDHRLSSDAHIND